jgi:FMN phosphatase YigB (HAD superfamily)
MSIAAAIFDVYKTLLEVGPPPPHAEGGWQELWLRAFGSGARFSLADFAAGCSKVIEREHQAARSVGIAFPEVYWPHVAGEVVEELTSLSPHQRDAFLLRQAQLWHTTRLQEGVVDVLRQLRERGVCLGLASNAQPYTLSELDEALAPHGLDRSAFCPDLQFWSFQHGFSKPDPHVFRLLTARLAARGIAPQAALMVGDRLDNDILPARAQGWQTWHLAGPATAGDGSWSDLARRHCVSRDSPSGKLEPAHPGTKRRIGIDDPQD